MGRRGVGWNGDYLAKVLGVIGKSIRWPWVMKVFDILVGELVGVDPVAVVIAGKARVAVDRSDVRFFGPFGDLEHPHFVADLIEQFGLLGWGGGGIFLQRSRPPVEFQSVEK
jgi:hypothetical protein